ncbi:hypothetical protein HPE56_18330, partial [Maribacter sp. ANRC-HE7]|nr:hypothetical protein [Maribacter aquimaris]
MNRKILILIFIMFSGFAFSQTTVNLEDQCNCTVLSGPEVTAPGMVLPAGADTGDIYVNTNTGTIYFWDGDSWELTSNDTNTTNASFSVDAASGDLVMTDSDGNDVRVSLAAIAAETDTNTTNASLSEDGVDLILTDSDLNTVAIPLADIAAQVNTNTTNVTFTVNTTSGTLDIIDSDTNLVSVPLADIAAEVNTDDQNATEVNLLNPIDVDGDSTNETTVEEAIANLAANNALDLDIDPTNELATSGNGSPVGAPANDNPGVTYLDTSTNELYVYDGTNWTMVTDNQNAGEVVITPAGNLTSTDVQAALEELDSDITTSELTTTVVEGSGTDVSTNVVGNNTEYTVAVNVSELTGDGDITSGDLTVGGDANALLGDVTLEIAAGAVGNTELAADAVTSDKILDGTISSADIAADAVNATTINADVAGVGLVQNASGALDVDVTALTGDGSITSTDLTVTGGANSTLNDVTLTIADNAITNAKMADDAITTAELATGAVESSDILDGTIATGDIADDAVTLGKLAAGSASGDLIQWNGTDWVYIAPSTLIPATTVSNTSAINTLSTTVDGVTGTGVDIINSNALSLNGSNELISTVNGEASVALDLTPAISATELTTTVVEGTGIDVSSTTSGNNTEYTVTVDPTDIIGDGSITSSEIDVTGGANATLNDVTLTIADNAITNAKMADDAITTAELATGAVESSDILDGTIATGDIANDAVTLGKLANGTALGQVMQWDGSDWTLVDLGSVTVTENDGVIGNEVTGATNGTLALSGAGTTVSPYTLAVAADGITNAELADDAVGLENIAAGSNAGDLIQWNGTDWVYIAPSTLIPATTVSNSSNVNTLTTTVDGVTGTGVPIVNSNALSLNGSNELISTVNGEASNLIDLSPFVNDDTNEIQDAGEVAFDDSTASLGETDVQGAIEALASATDNDTQYTAGNGLNLDGSNEFTAVASPDADNALDVRANGIYVTDTNTEYTAGNGLNLDGSNEFTAVVDPAANNALSVSGSGLYATDTDDQDAGEVTFDDSTTSLGETDVQGAIEALASATDNDTQYTAGNGLNLDGSNEFTAVASPDANNALDVRANGIYATDTNTEYTAGNGLNLDGSNEFTAVVDPAANNALSVSGSGLLATDDQNAGEVTFDDSTASLGETDVQGAIEALASATDNDTQYTAGNGLNLDGSNEFTAVASPDANNALDVRANGIYATDTNTEYTAGSGLNLDGSNEFTAVVDPAANNALSVSGSGLLATDDQDAGEVTFDDSTASLGETDVQGAIEALASATDNDTQYTAGNGLNLDGSNEFTAVVDPAANNALSVSGSGLLATDDQNAGEVAFDDSTASLGETDVQGAIEALASATDNDTQYTAGNGLNLDGSNEFTAVVDPAANNALSVSGSGLLATDDQNAGEVAFTATGNTVSTDVQSAIVELQTEIDGFAATAGQTNTASNVGTGGVGVFARKAGADLEFKNINAGSNKVTVTNDTGNDEIDIDINEANLAIGATQVSVTDSGDNFTTDNVEAALAELAGRTDNDTQYTAGNGLNLDGSNVFTAVVDPAANNALSVSASGLYATDTDDQNAGEVTFDDSTASLGETDVQGAIEALASATDNDTQYTAGNGLNLDGSNEFTAVVDPAANNALSISGSGLYATDTDDQNAGEVTFDDSTASLGETDVQGAIEALASATDNDTQYT